MCVFRRNMQHKMEARPQKGWKLLEKIRTGRGYVFSSPYYGPPAWPKGWHTASEVPSIDNECGFYVFLRRSEIREYKRLWYPERWIIIVKVEYKGWCMYGDGLEGLGVRAEFCRIARR